MKGYDFSDIISPLEKCDIMPNGLPPKKKVEVTYITVDYNKLNERTESNHTNSNSI